LIKRIILEENFKWHLEAFASELFIYKPIIDGHNQNYIRIIIIVLRIFVKKKISPEAETKVLIILELNSSHNSLSLRANAHVTDY